MKKNLVNVVVMTLILVVIISANFVSARPPVNPCPIKSDTDIVFYGETGNGGVGTPSRSWMIHFFDWWKSQDPSISYVELNSGDVKTDCNFANFPNLKLYVQPGGNAYYQQNKLGTFGKNNIINYLNNNGSFFGACAGFYYAANDYYWQDEYFNHADLLGIYPTLEGSIREIADYDQSPGFALTSLDNGFNAIYYGGPTRGYEYTDTNYPGETKAKFNALNGDMPAIIKYNKMLLTSVHLEAYENDGISGLSSEDRIENYKLLANNLNEVMGTSFYVPDYVIPPTPQCSDGIDNDGDNLTDYPQDDGCDTLEDNSEIVFNEPGQIFYDDFELGLGNWQLSAVSGANNWISSSVNPYQGTKYAESKPMSTSEPASNIEKWIPTYGYGNIKVSYARRLIGLDSADEFKAKWYDGTTWNLLEQTGSNSANDAGYLFKQFNLPSSANDNGYFRIRFECTAGAVSEFCRVDNVKVESI